MSACPSIASIQAAVARFYDIPLREMTSQRRERSAAHARQVAMYLAHELTPFSYPMIGREFGKRDHTTVMHGVSVVKNRIAARPSEGKAIAGLIRSLSHPVDNAHNGGEEMAG